MFSLRSFFLSVSVCLLIFLLSCQHGGRSSENGQTSEDTLSVEMDSSFLFDSEQMMEDEILQAEESRRLDGSFEDFLFAFTQSRKIQQLRTLHPLPLVTRQSNGEVLAFDATEELSFLEGDYYTVLYGDHAQIESEKDTPDSVASVERIDLQTEQVRVYSFSKNNGKWKLIGLQDTDLSSSELSDFLTFYARFSMDSLFQSLSIAQPLHITIQDSEDEQNVIDGTIDASQWSSFRPEVPSGVISNIRHGQHYNIHQMVMMKSGVSNGMQELFTFHRTSAGWELTKYEN